MKLTNLMFLAVMVAATAHAADSRVEFRECPKCDKRIRIDLAGNKAYVNLSRLEGAGRDAVAARAPTSARVEPSRRHGFPHASPAGRSVRMRL